MTNKEFAEKNAGKYFLYNGLIVRVVGYHQLWPHILVSMGANKYDLGWGPWALDEDDVFVIRSGAPRFLYVEEWQLSAWE